MLIDYSQIARTAGAYAIGVLGDPALVAAMLTMEAGDEIAGPRPPFLLEGDQVRFDHVVQMLRLPSGVRASGDAAKEKAPIVTVRLDDIKDPRAQMAFMRNATGPDVRTTILVRQSRTPVAPEVEPLIVRCRDVGPTMWGTPRDKMIETARTILDAWRARGAHAPHQTKAGFPEWSHIVLGAMETASLNLSFLDRRPLP